jgi:cullin 1
MQEAFQGLLDNEKEDDLNRMYNLLSRIPNGLDPLRDRFEAHVKKAGLEAVEKVVTGDKASDVVSYSLFRPFVELLRKGSQLLILYQDPKAYVDALLEVHLRNADLVSKAFKSDPGFVASLDKVSY